MCDHYLRSGIAVAADNKDNGNKYLTHLTHLNCRVNAKRKSQVRVLHSPFSLNPIVYYPLEVHRHLSPASVALGLVEYVIVYCCFLIDNRIHIHVIP